MQRDLRQTHDLVLGTSEWLDTNSPLVAVESCSELRTVAIGEAAANDITAGFGFRHRGWSLTVAGCFKDAETRLAKARCQRHWAGTGTLYSFQ